MEEKNQQTGKKCPACGAGRLHPRTERETVEYHGQSGEIELRYSLCDTCGSDLTGAEDARQNKREMNAFKKCVDGLLTGSEIKAFRKRFNLTQKLAARLIGGGEVAFSRYESDDVVQSAAMDTALRLCIASPSNLLALAQTKNIDLPEEIVVQITTDHRDRLVFMARAIRQHLDQELSSTRSRTARRSSSTFESTFVCTGRRTKSRNWGQA